MPVAKKIQRNRSPKDGEFLFEQWAKYLTIFILDEDILNDFKSSSRIIENVTAEKLRCVFSQGYRFAMLQVLQSSKKIYNIAEDGEALEPEEVKHLLKVIRLQHQLIIEKFDDSFILNRVDGKEGMTLSKKLKDEFDRHEDRDYLRWGSMK